MIRNTIRKVLVALIILTPVFTYTDCRKQSRCGCGKDVLRTLTNVSAYIYYTDGASIDAYLVGNMYAKYSLCNPSAMFPKLADAKSGDILLLSGHVYWDCNYVYQSSNSSYQSMYQGYNIEATDLSLDLYGKNKPSDRNQFNPATTKN
jgi:hypothetical protein